MKTEVTTLEAKKAGTVDLPEHIFGLEPRVDILHRMVVWQLAKRQAGTHKTLARGEISRTGAKAFGPKPRSHASDLPKKVRALALRHALSSKLKSAELIVLDSAEAASLKTKDLAGAFAKLGWSNALIVDGAMLNTNFALAARNLGTIDVLPVQGINVYDILRRDKLVLTKAAIEALEARFA